MGRTVATISGHSSPSSSSSSSAESSFRELDDVFLQNQTRIWLGEVLHTRLDDQLTISDLLADGELLFEVSKIVWTMLLAKCKELRHIKGHKYKPIGSRKSSGKYRPYSNVDSFLKICKILGLDGIDLFSPSDVVEKRDTRKVCICIRSLSKRARSKQLNVPDFDIVTYAAAMPTNMVGNLHRSLELSQCSFSSSANYSPCKESALKFRKKNQVAARDRNYDSYSEASDDSEINYMGMPSYGSSINYSHDTASLNYSDIDNSPGVSSVVNKYTSAVSVSQGDIQEHEKEEYEQGQHKSACLAEPALCLQYVKSDHQLYSVSSPHDDSQMILCDGASLINNGGRHIHEMAGLGLTDIDAGIGNDASIVGDSMDDNTAERWYISNQLAFPDLAVLGTDNNNPFLFDGEDSMFNLLLGTGSHEFNSTGRTSQNGFGRRSDDFEDVEVSSVNSMSSVLGRALNLDFDDQSNADDWRTAKINLTDLQNYEADSLDRSSTRGYEFQDIGEYESSEHSLIHDTERSCYETKFRNFGFSSELSSPCPNSGQSHTIEYEEYVGSFNNEIGVSRTNSGVTLLKDMDFTVADNATEVNSVAVVELDPVLRKHPNNCLPVACSSNIRYVRYGDSIVSRDSVTVEGIEKYHRQSLIDDGGLKHWDTTIRDVKPKAEKNPCSTIGSSANVGESGHQARTGCNEHLLYWAEYMNKDESKNENVDNLAELSGEKKSESARPHRRPLLRTVVKGTALFGLLCLLLHLRSGREKTGEVRKQSNQIQKENGMEFFATRKEQKGGSVNGIYPAEKLKFEN